MANTYASLYYHVIFSTKNLLPWLRRSIEHRVWAYVGGIARTHELTAIQIGGIEDHMHALIKSPPRFSPSQIAQFLKGDSSKWIYSTFKNMSRFAWQDGYGAFTVDSSTLPEVIQYIQDQREHHRVKTFQEEYLEFLKSSGISFDERYLWG